MYSQNIFFSPKIPILEITDILVDPPPNNIVYIK